MKIRRCTYRERDLLPKRVGSVMAAGPGPANSAAIGPLLCRTVRVKMFSIQNRLCRMVRVKMFSIEKSLCRMVRVKNVFSTEEFFRTMMTKVWHLL